MKGTMFRTKAFWIVLAVIALLAGGGYAAYAAGWPEWLAPQEKVQETTLETSMVTVGDISITAEGFRGTIDHKIREGKVVSTEWNWHGQTEAEFAALLLAPGQEWPFSVEITAQDMASFLLHPDAAATERQSAPVALSGVQVFDDGTGYLRISGAATNENAFAIETMTVSGVLLDASRQIVSLGSTYVIKENIAPGKSVHFDVRVAKEAYADYQLYAQAERDWS